MRILYLSQFFLPEIAAGTSRAYGLAREWTRAGHEVTVLTFFPHYPKGEAYPGFEYGNRLFKEETIEGIRVLRAFNLFYRPHQLWKRAADLPLGAFTSALTGLLDSQKHDVVIATSPQPLLFFSALAIGKLHGIPTVLEIRDHWPEAISGSSLLIRAAVPPAKRLIKEAYRQANLVVGVSPFYREVFRSYGVPDDKMAIFENGLDEGEFPLNVESHWKEELGLTNRFVVSFVGTIGRNMGLETVLESARDLANTNAHFLFVGHGARREPLEQRAQEMGLKNITFHPPVERDKLAGIYKASDVSLACLANHPFHKPRIPAKLWEILGMGIPMILCAPNGAAKAVAVNQAGGALWVPPEDSKALTTAIRTLMNNPTQRKELGTKGQTFVRNGFTRAQIARRYAERLKALVKQA